MFIINYDFNNNIFQIKSIKSIKYKSISNDYTNLIITGGDKYDFYIMSNLNSYIYSNTNLIIPKTLNLFNITQFVYECYFLTSIPHNIKTFNKLIELNFSCNKITIIPQNIKYLKKLENLDLSYNKISFIPKFIGEITSLKKLEIYHNNIKLIPNSIVNLKNLLYLNISQNKLKLIPEHIGQLTNLKYLNLANNKLNIIPNSINQLTNLYHFICCGNKNLELPKNIGSSICIIKSKYTQDLTFYPHNMIFLSDININIRSFNDIIKIPYGFNYILRNKIAFLLEDETVLESDIIIIFKKIFKYYINQIFKKKNVLL